MAVERWWRAQVCISGETKTKNDSDIHLLAAEKLFKHADTNLKQLIKPQDLSDLINSLVAGSSVYRCPR